MALAQANSGNIVVRNYGNNPAVNFNFLLRVEGIYDLPCRSVHVFQKENEYELIQEGGLNDYVHMRRKPISKPFTFQVERYVGTDILDPLANGTDLALPVILMVNRYRIYGDFLPVRMYVFTGCTVMAKKYGELNAEKGGLLVETTTIAYRELVCTENVAGSFLMEEPWKFESVSKAGNGNQSANRSRDEESAARMEERAKKWMFAGGDSARRAEGKGPSSNGQNAQPDFRGINGSTTDSAYALKELRKAQMEGRASGWSFHRDEEASGEGEAAMPDFLGSGGSTTRNTYTRELRKSAMEGKAKKWSFAGEGEESQVGFLGSNGSTTKSTYAQNEVRRDAMEEKAKKWSFTGDGDGEGSQAGFMGSNGSTTGSSYAQNEVRKDTMEEKAKKWSFAGEGDGDGSQAGFLGSNGSTTGSSYAQNEVRKDAMEGKAKKWSFDAGEGGEEGSQAGFMGSNGSTTGSTYAQNEMRKAAMEDRAQRWPPKRSAVDTAKFLAARTQDS